MSDTLTVAPVYQALAQRMIEQNIGSLSDAADNWQGALPAALQDVFEREYPHTLDPDSDIYTAVGAELNVGESVWINMNRRTGGELTYGDSSRNVARDYGEWMVTQMRWVKDFKNAPSAAPFPDRPSHWQGAHTNVYEGVRAWANNTNPDVAEGVDAQMVALDLDFGTRCINGCSAHAATKDFIGAAMRYKKARLSIIETPAEVRTFNEGDKVRLLIGEGEELAGKKCTAPYAVAGKVLTVNDSARNGPGTDTHGRVIATYDVGDDGQWWFHAEHLELVDETPEDLAANGEAARIAELERRLEEAERRHQEDVALIGKRLTKEAKEHAWCSEYEDVINDLNTELVVSLPERVWDYQVTATDTYIVTIPRSMVVAAKDANDAVEQVTFEALTEDELIDQLRIIGDHRRDDLDNWDADTV